ncbi:MAG: right-handed parallel beta-helix repeat-containing protein, partial [Candidatus Methylarchaceae archaeon HK02M2]|nr:right-handed parallel beta-helix repeat-containing protein [Candidatus Methylarchaceae archaeon HK02M2]
VGNGEEIYSSNDECGIYGDNEVLYNDDPNSQHNIRIKGNKIAANVNHGIYLEYVNGVSISSNLISSNIGDGISLYKCPIVSITHNKILVNEYIYENNAGTDECGIHYVGDSLWNLDEIALSLTISNNKIMGNIGAGVHIENTENIVITYNEILWNQGSGIEINRHHYMGPTGNDGEFLMVKNVLIAYNVISENGGIGYMLDLGPDQFNSMSMGDGIYMDMISEVEIIYNKITGNRGRGIGIGEGIIFTIAITANSNNEVHVGEDLLIKGNIISGNEYAGIYVDHFDSPVTIEWNTILGNGNEGIHLFHVENPQILHNTIMYTFTTFIRNGPVCGILSIECMGVRIAYNTIAYNMIHNIDILHSNDVIIEHNNIIGAIENGINIDSLMEEEVGCEDVTIQYNKICDNKGDGINWYRSFGLISNNMIGYSGSLSGNENGIFLHDCRSNNEGPTTISDNTILGNYDGIQCRGSDPTIIGNYIANNVYGIWLDIGQGDPSYPLIGGSPTNRNYIIRNYKDGICIADTISDPVINYNNIYDNVGYGVYCKFPLDAIDAENNFWGDISGPGNPATFGVGPGSGDEISNNFTYSPWLVSIIP